jgi:CYTH domain-containing protein
MGIEIERKFLVLKDKWSIDGRKGMRLLQGYLSSEPTVRVRASESEAWLTIKSRMESLKRHEFEYAIPVEDARALLALCGDRILEKTRYDVEYDGHTWEIDVFHGANEGLVTAEIELDDKDEQFNLPPFIGDEVSSDPRYANSQLVLDPWMKWRGDAGPVERGIG